MPENTTPLAGVHCVLHRFVAADTEPTAATAVAQLTAVGDIDISREMDEYHVYQDEWMRKLATTLSAGSVEFEAVFIGSDEDQTAVRAGLLSGVSAFYGVSYAPKGVYDSGTLTKFSAIIGNYARMAPLDGKVAIKFTAEITGPVTDSVLA